jgi:putative solute:sodium symporter small subunit
VAVVAAASPPRHIPDAVPRPAAGHSRVTSARRQGARATDPAAARTVAFVHTALLSSPLFYGHSSGRSALATNHDRHLRYWRANFRLILALLAIWAFISIGCGILFVPLLNTITFFGVPLGFWIAQQGSIYVFVALIFLYAWRMDAIDHKYHEDE